MARFLDIILTHLTLISNVLLGIRSCMTIVRLDHCFLCLPKDLFQGLSHPPGIDSGLQTIACRVESYKLQTTRARGGQLSLRLRNKPKREFLGQH